MLMNTDTTAILCVLLVILTVICALLEITGHSMLLPGLWFLLESLECVGFGDVPCAGTGMLIRVLPQRCMGITVAFGSTFAEFNVCGLSGLYDDLGVLGSHSYTTLLYAFTNRICVGFGSWKT